MCGLMGTHAVDSAESDVEFWPLSGLSRLPLLGGAGGGVKGEIWPCMTEIVSRDGPIARGSTACDAYGGI